MTITTPPQQADTVLARDYERLKPDILRTVRGKLAASGVRFDDSDLDGFYNQAWHGVHTKLAEGERVENVNGLLVTITQRRALDEFRALRAESRVDAEALLGHGIDPDLASQVDDHTRLRQFIEGMRERLNGREREAAALCYVQDYSRPEAAQAMGIKPRRMEKIMDGVSKKVGAFVGDIERDEWCDARHSMIKAYALGLLDPEGERYALAQEHLESCSRCRRDVLRMRGIAALGPPPALLFLAAGGCDRRGRRRRPRAVPRRRRGGEVLRARGRRHAGGRRDGRGRRADDASEVRAAAVHANARADGRRRREGDARPRADGGRNGRPRGAQEGRGQAPSPQEEGGAQAGRHRRSGAHRSADRRRAAAGHRRHAGAAEEARVAGRRGRVRARKRQAEIGRGEG